MYELTVISEFSAAHNLRNYEGKCEKLHGHNWKIEATVLADSVDRLGLAVDFKLLKGWLKDILEGFDHRYLNELPPFSVKNPSSENIAVYIFRELKKKIGNFIVRSGQKVSLKKITVWESERAGAAYYEP